MMAAKKRKERKKGAVMSISSRKGGGRLLRFLAATDFFSHNHQMALLCVFAVGSFACVSRAQTRPTDAPADPARKEQIASARQELTQALKLSVQGDLPHALDRSSRALDLFQKMYGDQATPDTSRALDTVASCLSRMVDDRDALPLWEQAVAMNRRLCAADQPGDAAQKFTGERTLAVSVQRLARCLRSLGAAERSAAAFAGSAAVA